MPLRRSINIRRVKLKRIKTTKSMPFTNDLSYCDSFIAKAVFGKTARSEKPIHFVKQPTRLEVIQDVNPCFRIFNVFHTRYFLRRFAVLSTPTFQGNGGAGRDRTDDLKLAKLALSQLSYGPDLGWWAREDLNLRPHAYQACALTS